MSNFQYLGHVDLNGPIAVSGTVVVSPSAGALFSVALYDASGNPLTSSGGALNVNATFSGTPTFDGDIVSWNGVTVGNPTTYGTAPTGQVVIGTNSFVTNTVAVSGTVAVSNFPASFSISNFPATQAVSGTVAVSNFPATQPVSGTVAVSNFPATVAVTQSTSPWVVSGAVTVSGTVAFSNTTIAVTQGTSPWVVSLASTTVTGTVAVTQSTSPWVVSLTSTTVTNTVADNLIQVAGVTLGATAVTAYGTAPAAANVPGVNAFITNTPAVTLASTTITGNVAIVGTKSNDANIGATNLGVLPAVANAAAPTDTEAKQVTLSVDLAGNLRVGTIYNAIPTLITSGSMVQTQSDPAGSMFCNNTGRIPTYRCAAVAFVPVASSTSPLFSIQGSSTKTVRIHRIKVSWSSVTGNTGGNTLGMRRYSVLTGGTTGSTPAITQDDTNDPAPTAVVLQYSAVPTTATVIPAGSFFSAEAMFWQSSTPNASLPIPVEWTFGDEGGEAITLRGTSDYAGIFMAAIGSATPLAWIRIMWTESS